MDKVRINRAVVPDWYPFKFIRIWRMLSAIIAVPLVGLPRAFSEDTKWRPSPQEVTHGHLPIYRS